MLQFTCTLFTHQPCFCCVYKIISKLVYDYSNVYDDSYVCIICNHVPYYRYDELAESVEDYVLDVLRDQLNRRQPMDNVSRNLLRLLTATCGYKEARLMAVQRLEMWLQNPKVRAGNHFYLLPAACKCSCLG